MPNTITFEREKLNQAMYQKLKKFIMNKRRREAEERAQADYYKRLRKEREERKRLIQFSAESLENARREILETKNKLSRLKAEKDAVFTRFKQLTQESKHREMRSRSHGSKIDQANLYPDQYQSRATQEALLLLSKASHKGCVSACFQDVINQTNALRKQVGQLYGTSQYPSSSLSHATHESPVINQSANHNLGSLSFNALDKRQVGVLSHQQQVSSRGIADAVASGFPRNREFTSHDIQNISEYWMEFGAAEGRLQSSDILSAIDAGAVSALLNNPKLTSAVTASSLGGTSAARSSLANTGLLHPSPTPHSTFLPPAPTGYRGSITTGQSAQQIAAQQQAAALYGSRASQQLQQHDYTQGG